MTVNDIAHVLVEGEGINTLYLADGRIARVSTLSGKVMSVVRLPTEEALQDSERKSTARRSRQLQRWLPCKRDGRLEHDRLQVLTSRPDRTLQRLPMA